MDGSLETPAMRGPKVQARSSGLISQAKGQSSFSAYIKFCFLQGHDPLVMPLFVLSGRKICFKTFLLPFKKRKSEEKNYDY